MYLTILNHVDNQVQAVLHHDSPDWRLHHACPACTYRLQDEKPLTFSMLYMQDGNNSLKRIQRQLVDADGTPGASCEHIDMRIVG